MKIEITIDLTQWNNAKWYHKLLGNIVPAYKRRFIDVKIKKVT